MLTTQTLKKNFLSFVHSRFPSPQAWMNGDCFQFAYIILGWLDSNNIPEDLRHVVYDTIDGHFQILLELEQHFFLLDWGGVVEIHPTGDKTIIYQSDSHYIVRWPDYKNVDDVHYGRILKYCCL